MKKILVISQSYTPPVYAGNQKCILEYCQLLKNLGAQVSLLYLQGHKQIDKDDLQILKSYWGESLYIFRRKLPLEIPVRLVGKLRSLFTDFNFLDEKYPFGLTSFVRKLQKKHGFDIIIINYLTLSRLFIADLQCKKVLFAHDCFTFKNQRLKSNKTLFNLKPDDEAKALRRCDTILSIQDNETTLFRYLYPDGDIKTVYSIFPTHPAVATTPGKNILFFSGDSQLNVNGITRFVEQAFPLILEKAPDARLIIAGNICNKLKNLNHPNITLQGRIQNADDFYNQGSIVINPVYQGTGLKIKTLEALSYGKAVVVHPHSTEGLFNQGNIPVFVAETPREFADCILMLMQNECRTSEACSKALDYIDCMNSFIKKQYKDIITS